MEAFLNNEAFIFYLSKHDRARSLYQGSNDEEMISLCVNFLFESFDFVHDEGFFSWVDSVDCGVEGNKADTEEGAFMNEKWDLALT